jgi:hypothetical protein
MSGSGGMSVVSMTNINNYDSHTKGGDTNLNTTNVYADNAGSGGEQRGMNA